MSIKGFRIKSDNGYLNEMDTSEIPGEFASPSDTVLFHTGTYDRKGEPIFEGDTLRQMSCEQTFKVEDIVSFLLMCGRYEAKHGAPIFDSLEVVTE